MTVSLIAFIAVAICFEVFTQIAFRNTRLHHRLGWHSDVYSKITVGMTGMPALPSRTCRWCHRDQIQGFMRSAPDDWLSVDIGTGE